MSSKNDNLIIHIDKNIDNQIVNASDMSDDVYKSLAIATFEVLKDKHKFDIECYDEITTTDFSIDIEVAAKENMLVFKIEEYDEDLLKNILIASIEVIEYLEQN